MRRTLILFAVLAMASCGSQSKTPTAPSFPSVAGTWSGTIDQGNQQTTAVQVLITQSDGTIVGTWTSASGWTGTLAGTVNSKGSTNGSISISVPNPAGGACTGNGTFGGGFSASLFMAAVNGVTTTCGNVPASFTLLTQRQ